MVFLTALLAGSLTLAQEPPSPVEAPDPTEIAWLAFVGTEQPNFVGRQLAAEAQVAAAARYGTGELPLRLAFPSLAEAPLGSEGWLAARLAALDEAETAREQLRLQPRAPLGLPEREELRGEAIANALAAEDEAARTERRVLLLIRDAVRTHPALTQPAQADVESELDRLRVAAEAAWSAASEEDKPRLLDRIASIEATRSFCRGLIGAALGAAVRGGPPQLAATALAPGAEDELAVVPALLARHLFGEAGATIDGQLMRFDPGLVRHIVTRSAPREFVQHARDPERSVTIGGDHTVFAPGYGMPFVRDLDGGRRYGTMADFERLVKINQTLEYTHHSGLVICEPTDVPVNKRHLDMLATHFRYGSKPMLGAITAPERALDSIEMARLVFGAEYLEGHCVIMGNINVNSPLVFDGQVTEVIRHYAAANQGIVTCPFILGGAMGPVTPAGAVAQAHAEAMVGVALTQLVRSGAPAIYGNFLTTMSLRSGAPTFGTPEASLAYFAVGQLARRLGIPVRCGGAFTSAKLPDAQSAQESANSMLAAMMSGANFVLHAAGWLEGGLVMDYEKLVLDNDRLGMLHTMLRGMPLDDNAFAMDGFNEVGPGSHFLGSAHTLANYETAYYESPFGDSMSWEQWNEEGELDARQRANADWKARLADYEQPPLPPGVDEALEEFVEKKKAAVADAWY